MDDAEWRLYQKIYKSFEPYFSQPDLIVYLEAPISVLSGRIQKRGRGYEQKIPQSYLELLDMLNHKWLAENKLIPTVVIDTDNLDIVRNNKAKKKLVEYVRHALQTKSPSNGSRRV